MLINHFLKEDVEFYHVDVGEIEMPYQLEVSWTPYVRYVVNRQVCCNPCTGKYTVS